MPGRSIPVGVHLFADADRPVSGEDLRTALAGDMVGTVRLLRDAIAAETEWISAAPHVWFIRERASEAEHEALDRAGIPREPE